MRVGCLSLSLKKNFFFEKNVLHSEATKVCQCLMGKLNERDLMACRGKGQESGIS